MSLDISKRVPPEKVSAIRQVVAEVGNAVKAQEPARIAAAYRALNAAKIERAIRDNIAADHGIADEDRARLCALLHDEAVA